MDADGQWWSVRQAPVLGSSHHRAPRLQTNRQRECNKKELNRIEENGGLIKKADLGIPI